MTVEHIFIRPLAGEPQIECKQVRAVAGAGIVGDRYFGRHDSPGQNITLIEAEEIETFINEFTRVYDISITSRNVITRGVRLNTLLGKEFMIGTVKLRGVELCEPCLTLGETLATSELSAAEVLKRFLHRSGIRADVLSGGIITRGGGVHIAV